MKKAASTLIKLAIVVALLWLLARKGLLSVHEVAKAFTQWQYLAPALFVGAVSSLLGVLRWQILLRAQGIRLSFARVFQLTFIGNFFNVALPGAVSGDLVKAFYVGREVEGKRGRALGSILFDRVAGLSALVVLSASSLAIGYGEFEGTTLVRAIHVFMTIGAAAVVAFFAYLFLVRERHDPFMIILRRLQGQHPKVGSIVRIYEGLRHYHSHRIAVAQVIAISLVVHLMIGWCCLQYAYALGESSLHLLPIYVVVPLGLLITAVPVMPGGVGTGHVAFTYFFGLIGSQAGANVFSLFVLQQFFFGGIGGLIYLQFRNYQPKPDFASTQV